MTKTLLKSMLALALCLVATASMAASTKYIKAGARDGGNGSKHKPWNQLSQAEGEDWTTLKVLPSGQILFGGIHLSDNQNIEGEERDASLLASYSADIHNGDVIVAEGNNKISNITIVEAYRCGISALNAENLTVTNCAFTNTNTSGLRHPYDYSSFSTNRSTVKWAAIDFFGANPVSSGIQPFNTKSGTFTLTNCSFENNEINLLTGSGDQISTTSVTSRYNRHYDIAHCHFGQTTDASVVLYAGGGCYLTGSLRKCHFENAGTEAVYIASIRGNNPNFEGRGNYDMGFNKITHSSFTNIGNFGVLTDARGTLTGTDATIKVKKCTFSNYSTVTTGPAGLEYGYAAIQMQALATGSGYPLNWVVHSNHIEDPKGLLPAITTYFLGGQKVIANIKHNTIIGTTSGVDLLYYNEGTGAGQGSYHISHNTFKDNDCVLSISSDSPYGDLAVKAEKNCFQNTGARNTPSLQEMPFTTGSYYGGAVLFGGYNNTMLQAIGQGSKELGNVVVDFGGGLLESQGENSFINTCGAHFWVAEGLSLTAKNNWFLGIPPLVAGDGHVSYKKMRTSGKCHCESN